MEPVHSSASVVDSTSIPSQAVGSKSVATVAAAVVGSTDLILIVIIIAQAVNIYHLKR